MPQLFYPRLIQSFRGDVRLQQSTIDQIDKLLWKEVEFSLVKEDNHWSVNIYGPSRDSQYVGEKLDQAQAYLQHPACVWKGVRYDNPHYLNDPRNKLDLNQYVRAGGEEIRHWQTSDIYPMMAQAAVDRMNKRKKKHRNSHWGIASRLRRLISRNRRRET